MPIEAVTTAISDLLKASLANQPGIPSNAFTIHVGVPNGAASNADLILFLYLISPNGDLRNADRVRAFPGPQDPPQLLEPAVPLDLHYLVTTGPGTSSTTQALARLADGIRAVEAASPISVSSHFQEAVWLSLIPLNTDELSRIWGLFPNENCRTSFAFRASPVWIDPRAPRDVGPPVVSDRALVGPPIGNA